MAQQTFEFKEENHFLGFTDPSIDMKLDIGGFSKQMTAVEWLEKQLLSHTKIENSKYIQQEIIDIAVWQFNKYLEQAKQMEKGQMIDAWEDAYNSCKKDIVTGSMSTFDDYFKNK